MADPTPPDDKKPARAPAVEAKAAPKPAPTKPPAPAKAAAAAKPGAAKPAPGKGAAKPAAPEAPAEIAAPTMKAEIRARVRKGRRARFEVAPDGVILGRDDAAAVSIPLDGVSREHARIKWDGKGWWLEDLKSTNGTFVNGEKVLRGRLQHLDVISLGRKADVVFLLRNPAEAAPTQRKGILRAALVEADGVVHEIPVGEFTLGRSAACNVVADENAVSKVHARIERFSDQLLLEDLASSNGTFVNGARVRTAVLRDGDTVELANAAKFKVEVQEGDLSTSGFFRAPTLSKEGAPQFSGDWKTRFEWDPVELAAIAAASAGLRPAELDRGPEPPAGPKHIVQAGAKKAVAVTPPAAAAATPDAGQPAAPAKPVVVQAPPPGPAALEQPVPRPPKTASPPPAAPAPIATPAPAAGAASTPDASPAPAVAKQTLAERAAGKAGPAEGRVPTPMGTDPASTPSEPRLQPPANVGVSSPIIPAVAPADTPSARPPAPAPVPAPVAAPAPPRAPSAPDPRFASTVADVPALAVPAAPSAAPAAIAVVRFTSERFSFALTVPGRFDVGRATTTAFRVDHTTVSRRHAAITLSEDRQRLTVEDLGAANGTRVNRAEIKGTRDLHDGDVLELGEVKLKVTFERA